MRTVILISYLISSSVLSINLNADSYDSKLTSMYLRYLDADLYSTETYHISNKLKSPNATTVNINLAQDNNRLFFFTLSSLIFFLSVITFGQYLISKDKSYLYYAIFSLSNFAYYFLLYDALPSTKASVLLNPNTYSQFRYLTLIISYYGYAKFIFIILDIKAENVKINSIYKIFTSLSLVLIGIAALSIIIFSSSSMIFKIIGVTSLVLIMPFGIVTIYLILKVGTVLSKLLIIGTLCYFIASVLGFFFHLPALTKCMQGWIFDHPICFTGLGSLLESFFFFLALSYRYRLTYEAKIKLLKEKEEKAVEHQQQLQSISHDLHDEVGSTLSSIAILSEATLQQIGTNTGQAHLMTIIKSTRQIMDNMNDIVWSVNPDNDSTELWLERMKTFALEMLEAKGMLLHFSAELLLQKLSTAQRKDLYLIFKEAINNAAKYSDGKNVWVHFQQTENTIKLTIKDDGKGFHLAEVERGNGLNNMEQRARRLGGDWIVKSFPSQGTEIQLVFSVSPIYGMDKFESYA